MNKLSILSLTMFLTFSGCVNNHNVQKEEKVSSTSIVVTQQMIDEMKNRRGK